jgi:hypothetical protein
MLFETLPEPAINGCKYVARALFQGNGQAQRCATQNYEAEDKTNPCAHGGQAHTRDEEFNQINNVLYQMIDSKM